MIFYCRGCGLALPECGRRKLYHTDCRDGEKRERVRARREREMVRMKRFHFRQICPCCGKRIKNHARPETS